MYIYILNMIMHAYDIIYIYLDALYTHTFVYICILYTYHTHTHINHRKPRMRWGPQRRIPGTSSPTLGLARWQDVFCCHRKIDEIIPRYSMYGIFTYIYPKNSPNVGKYSIHGASGIWNQIWLTFADWGKGINNDFRSALMIFLVGDALTDD